MFDNRSDFPQRDCFHIIGEKNRVGIAHRDEHTIQQLVALENRNSILVLASTFGEHFAIDGNFGQVENRLGHVHRDLLDLAVFHF